MKTIKPKIVSYYERCDVTNPGAADFYGDGRWYVLVKKPTTDKYLLDAVRLARMYGGIPWRDGNGIDPDTRYGIKQLN